MKKFKLLFLFTLACTFTFGQHKAGIFSRLQAISNQGIVFYNVDGIEITNQEKAVSFSPKEISRNFKNLKIKKKELTNSDSLLEYKNYYVFESVEKPEGFHNNLSTYFVESPDTNVIGFTFASINKSNRDFQRYFIKLVVNDEIPDSVFNQVPLDTIDFAGRKIGLGNSCHWMGINNVQCPYYGQMNWSVHRDSADAKSTVNNQFETIKARKNGKIVADTTVSVIFEGAKTTARRVVYDFTGVTSALVGMSGGKTLTIYLVAAPVRGHYVSCVLSFWNNDQINPSGLAPLLEKVMKLD